MTDELKEFLIDTAYRCAYTFAEAMLGFIGVGVAINDIPWKLALSVSAVAVLACLLKQVIVYSQQHTKPQYTESELNELMQGVEEPIDSWFDRHFTDDELTEYRANNPTEDGEEDV